MKVAPKTVFILENGKYNEITYNEFEYRKANIAGYKQKWFLRLHGVLMEVKREDYLDWHKKKRRQKYINECAYKNQVFSYSSLDTEEFNGEDILIDESYDMQRALEYKDEVEALHKAVIHLSKDEQCLIEEIFAKGQSERSLAKKYGISQPAIHKKKQQILEKLKIFLKK